MSELPIDDGLLKDVADAIYDEMRSSDDINMESASRYASVAVSTVMGSGMAENIYTRISPWCDPRFKQEIIDRIAETLAGFEE